MGWKRGPLPAGTWGYGGVVTTDVASAEDVIQGTCTKGFQFADFQGDHVVLYPGKEIVPADKAAFWNNGLQLPINAED